MAGHGVRFGHVVVRIRLPPVDAHVVQPHRALAGHAEADRIVGRRSRLELGGGFRQLAIHEDCGLSRVRGDDDFDRVPQIGTIVFDQSYRPALRVHVAEVVDGRDETASAAVAGKQLGRGPSDLPRQQEFELPDGLDRQRSKSLNHLSLIHQPQTRGIRLSRAAERLHGRGAAWALLFPVSRCVADPARGEGLVDGVAFPDTHQRQGHLANRFLAGLDQDVIQTVDGVEEGHRFPFQFAIHIDVRGLGHEVGNGLDAVGVIEFERNQRHGPAGCLVAELPGMRGEADGGRLQVAKLPCSPLHRRRQEEAERQRDLACSLPCDLVADRNRVLVAGVAEPERYDVEREIVGKETARLGFPSPAALVRLPAGQQRFLFPNVGPDGSEGAVHQVAYLDVPDQRRRVRRGSRCRERDAKHRVSNQRRDGVARPRA